MGDLENALDGMAIGGAWFDAEPAAEAARRQLTARAAPVSVNPEHERPPKPRPDFTVRRGARMWLLGAKYRHLWCKGLPASVLYQLSVYALSQGQGATAAILYPTESPEACEEVLTICAPRTGIALGQVALRPVLMSRLVSALSAPASDGARALARELAFGGDRAHSLPEPEHAQRTLLTSSLEPGG